MSHPKILTAEMIGAAIKSYQRVAFIFDANGDPAERWQEATRSFNANGVNLPDSLDPLGLILDLPESKQLGIWMMPDNVNPGAIEEFLVDLVPADDRCWAHAQTSTELALRLSSLEKKDQRKGDLRSWLAWQKQPGLPFGKALERRLLNSTSASADLFVGWFKRLFPG